MSENEKTHPICRLDEEDLNMVLALVLASGSIKALARQYGVSYPTMRLRLDRLIERVRQCAADSPPDPLSDYLGALIAKGAINPADARRIRELHRTALDGPLQTPPLEPLLPARYEKEGEKP